jgi:signal recognition particle receptor subunit beta
MVFFNWATMQMAAKIVYYGPGLCGKTSNLSFIYAKTAPNSRGEMVSLETESDRTLFFDLLPIEVGTIGGFKTRLQLYTVPGQVFYNTTRRLVLKGVDGLVFVADSQRPMREANLESFESLRANLEELSVDVNELPVVLQYNKRDLKNLLAVEELNSDLNPDGAFAFHESEAINGVGVFETLKEITKLTLKKLRKRMVAPHAASTGPHLAPPSIRPSPATPKRPSSVSAAALARAAEEGVDGTPQQAPRFAPEPDSPEPELGAASADNAEAPFASEPSDAAAPQFLENEPAAEATAEVHDTPIFGDGSPDESVAVSESPSEPNARVDSDFSAAVEAPTEFEAQEEFEDSDSFVIPDEIEVKAETAAAAEKDTDLEDGVRPPQRSGAPGPVDAPFAVANDDSPFGDVQPPAYHHDQGPLRGPLDEESDVKVEFDQTNGQPAASTQPPMKRVRVSNQMDILAELDGLRQQATMGAGGHRKHGAVKDLDIDALLADSGKSRELKRRVLKTVNSDIFSNMRGLQVAIRIQDADGETIHTLEPVSLAVDKADNLEKLSLRFTVDLENHR